MQNREEMDKNSLKYQEVEEIKTKWKDKYGVILANKKIS